MQYGRCRRRSVCEFSAIKPCIFRKRLFLDSPPKRISDRFAVCSRLPPKVGKFSPTRRPGISKCFQEFVRSRNRPRSPCRFLRSIPLKMRNQSRLGVIPGGYGRDDSNFWRVARSCWITSLSGSPWSFLCAKPLAVAEQSKNSDCPAIPSDGLAITFGTHQVPPSLNSPDAQDDYQQSTSGTCDFQFATRRKT